VFYVPNPAGRILPENSELMQLAGKVVGKALYEGLLIEVPFAPFFLARIAGQPPTVSDLRVLDPVLHRSLRRLAAYEGDFAPLGLSFAVTEDVLGRPVTRPLKPGGSDIAVTRENLPEYTLLVAEYYLSRATAGPTQAFLDGLYSVTPAHWLRLFDAAELSVLISGSRLDIDVDDWRRHTTYNGTAAPGDDIVRWFWEVIGSFTPAERSSLLRFATGCSRPPLGGFRLMAPPFAVRVHAPTADDGHGDDDGGGGFFGGLFGRGGGAGPDRSLLPSASTCFNLIKLPRYGSKAVLERKLRIAMQTTGFHLT